MDIIGWISGIGYLFAYFLVATKRYSVTSLTYQSLNIFFSIGLLTNTIYHKAYPSTFVNIIWIGIAFLSLLKYRDKSIKQNES